MAVLNDQALFYTPKHQLIFSAMLSLNRKSEPIDITTVGNHLESDGLLAKVGGTAYLVDIVECVASTANAASYARTVKEKAVRRQIAEVCDQVSRSCYEAGEPTDKIVDQLQQQAYDIGRGAQVGGFRLLSDDNADCMQRIADWSSGEMQKRLIRTGRVDLDNQIHGFVPGDYVLLGGYTSHGKTQLALQMAEHMSVEQGRITGIHSIEMRREALNDRLHYSLAKINSERVKRGELTTQDWDELAKAEKRTRAAGLWVDDSTAVTPAQLWANVRTLKSRHNIEIVFVDYVQIMNHATAKGDTHEQRLREGSIRLKNMAKELGVVVVALSQLTDFGATLIRPSVHGVRECRAMGQDVDIALFVWHWNDNGVEKSCVICDKVREGRRGDVRMTFENGQWKDYTDREEPHE